jgi:MoaA/NifB/PqqE/SkfB family radical SAM enzyme
MTDVAEIAARLRIPTVHFSNFMTAQEEHLDKTLLNVKDEYNAELDRARARAEELGVKTISRRFYNTDEKLVKGAETCLAPFDAAFVEMPGSMAPCCFMGRSRMGNVYEEGFETVWFGETMTKLRESRFLPACQTCTIHTPFDDPVAHMSPFLLDKSRTIEGPTDLSLAEGWKAKNKKH